MADVVFKRLLGRFVGDGIEREMIFGEVCEFECVAGLEKGFVVVERPSFSMEDLEGSCMTIKCAVSACAHSIDQMVMRRAFDAVECICVEETWDSKLVEDVVDDVDMMRSVALGFDGQAHLYYPMKLFKWVNELRFDRIDMAIPYRMLDYAGKAIIVKGAPFKVKYAVEIGDMVADEKVERGSIEVKFKYDIEVKMGERNGVVVLGKVCEKSEQLI